MPDQGPYPERRCVSCDKLLPPTCEDCMEYAQDCVRAPMPDTDRIPDEELTPEGVGEWIFQERLRLAPLVTTPYLNSLEDRIRKLSAALLTERKAHMALKVAVARFSTANGLMFAAMDDHGDVDGTTKAYGDARRALLAHPYDPDTGVRTSP